MHFVDEFFQLHCECEYVSTQLQPNRQPWTAGCVCALRTWECKHSMHINKQRKLIPNPRSMVAFVHQTVKDSWYDGEHCQLKFTPGRTHLPLELETTTKALFDEQILQRRAQTRIAWIAWVVLFASAEPSWRSRSSRCSPSISMRSRRADRFT